MKSIVFTCLFVVLISSCNSSSDGENLLNSPTDKVTLKVLNEEYSIDFRLGIVCDELKIFEVLQNEFSKLKTREDLINYYKTLPPYFSPKYSSMIDNGERIFSRVEYMLAQECFDENCNSKIRYKVLQLVVNKQKAKWNDENYIMPSCAHKTGVFLMAVILAREKSNSSKIFIDSTNLQKALLSLSSDEFISKDFNDLIIESSEILLINSKDF